jgi:hypothetical protein
MLDTGCVLGDSDHSFSSAKIQDVPRIGFRMLLPLIVGSDELPVEFLGRRARKLICGAESPVSGSEKSESTRRSNWRW